MRQLPTNTLTLVAAVTAADEAATNVKVFVGIEKPKPKPPKTPPPAPPTAGQIGMKVAGSVFTGVATGTVKLAWWAGKSAAVAAWKGVQSTAGSAESSSNYASVTEQLKTTKAAEELPSSPPSTSGNGDVDEEVQEALRLAQSALDFADRDSQENSEGKK